MLGRAFMEEVWTWTVGQLFSEAVVDSPDGLT